MQDQGPRRAGAPPAMAKGEESPVPPACHPVPALAPAHHSVRPGETPETQVANQDAGKKTVHSSCFMWETNLLIKRFGSQNHWERLGV